MTIRHGLAIEARPLALPLPGRKTASGGLQPWARRRVGRIRPQPTDAPWKNRPRYDGARRGSVLPQSGDGVEIIVTANIPSPPSNLPGGPYTAQPPTPGNRPGNFLGPRQPKGPRPAAQWVPPESQGGPPGSKGYWKVNLPGQPVQSYDQKGNPFSSCQAAHPNPPSSTRSFFFLGPVGAFLCVLFCESPAY